LIPGLAAARDARRDAGHGPPPGPRSARNEFGGNPPSKVKPEPASTREMFLLSLSGGQVPPPPGHFGRVISSEDQNTGTDGAVHPVGPGYRPFDRWPRSSRRNRP
jgi:hypothetical protein